MAALSLFIVLGGTSYAVATNSIGSAQIKNNSIRSTDIRNNQVTTSDVKNGSLLPRDFKPFQLPPGPRGIPGATGPRGLAGTNGTTSVTVREASGAAFGAEVDCNPGERATGGGGLQNGNGFINVSVPKPLTGTPTGWTVFAGPTAGQTLTGTTTAYVVCASP